MADSPSLHVQVSSPDSGCALRAGLGPWEGLALSASTVCNQSSWQLCESQAPSPVAGGAGLVYPKKECGMGQAAPPCSSGLGQFEFLWPSTLGVHLAPRSWRSHRQKGSCDLSPSEKAIGVALFHIVTYSVFAFKTGRLDSTKHSRNTAQTKHNPLISCWLYRNLPILIVFL